MQSWKLSVSLHTLASLHKQLIFQIRVQKTQTRVINSELTEVFYLPTVIIAVIVLQRKLIADQETTLV